MASCVHSLEAFAWDLLGLLGLDLDFADWGVSDDRGAPVSAGSPRAVRFVAVWRDVDASMSVTVFVPCCCGGRVMSRRFDVRLSVGAVRVPLQGPPRCVWRTVASSGASDHGDCGWAEMPDLVHDLAVQVPRHCVWWGVMRHA